MTWAHIFFEKKLECFLKRLGININIFAKKETMKF